MLAIQLPLSLIGAAAIWYLFAQAYPDVPIDDAQELLENTPSGLTLAIVLMSAVYGLFTLVGFSASIAAAAGVLKRKPPTLSEALDPGFSRMGAILLLAFVLYGVFLAGVITAVFVVGAVLAAYVLIRLGMVFPILVIDGTSAGGAIRASWTFLAGRMVQFLGVLLSLVPISVAILFWGPIVLALLLAPFVPSDPSRNTDVVAQSLAFIVLGAIMVPLAAFWAAGLTVYLFRQRGEANA